MNDAHAVVLRHGCSRGMAQGIAVSAQLPACMRNMYRASPEKHAPIDIRIRQQSHVHACGQRCTRKSPTSTGNTVHLNSDTHVHSSQQTAAGFPSSESHNDTPVDAWWAVRGAGAVTCIGGPPAKLKSARTDRWATSRYDWASALDASSVHASVSAASAS